MAKPLLAHLARDPRTSFASMLAAIGRGGMVRVVNFHNTPKRFVGRFEAQLAHLASTHASVAEADLDAWLDGGAWPHDRPGLIPIFYEGYKNNYDIGAPLVERYGFRGWFFVPSAFPDVPVPDQRAFADAHHIGVDPDDGDRVAMNWDEIRDLEARGHVIASHTRTHSPLVPASPDEAYLNEIVRAQEDFERELGHRTRAFAWLYGSEYGADARADGYVRKARYDFLFSNFKIQRIA